MVGCVWGDADAIMGVNFYGDEAPDDFGAYDLAIVTVFSMMAGNSWVGLHHVPTVRLVDNIVGGGGGGGGRGGGRTFPALSLKL